MQYKDHPHLSEGQREALHALGWRSPSEQRAAARREWWKKAGTYLAFAVAIIIMIKIFGAIAGAGERRAPDSWDCSACTQEWAGYDWAFDQDMNHTPSWGDESFEAWDAKVRGLEQKIRRECANGPGARWRRGCRYYTDSFTSEALDTPPQDR